MEMEMKMKAAMWIASVFGPYLTISGLWMLLYSDNLIKIMTAIKNSPGVFYLMGALNFLIGLAIIHSYNMWIWNMSFFVTLLGWVFMVRGLLSLFMPQLVMKVTMGNHTFMKAMGVIPFIWGLILVGFAYFK